jgi:DNA-directed RNA polymerase specialized sigma subunit
LGVNAAVGPTGTIQASGQISAWVSDRRLKTNIQEISNAVKKIENMTAIYYTPNKLAEEFGHPKEERQVGLIAQQVQYSVPQIVKLAPFDSTSDDRSISGHYFLTIQYEKLVPVLVQAIKEQQAQIAELLNILQQRSE